VLTKPLSRVKFEHFRDKVGIVERIFLKRGSSCCDKTSLASSFIAVT
jgi:hypothetical protein